ncbi:MAG: hypothetical protein PHE63_07385 [Eubacteriales bacterium]|nr:hypothetical protein [Eubacteriales bacterium]
MYKVIKGFSDLNDSKSTKSGKLYHQYNVGDVYPRHGIKADINRISELEGSENAQKEPLIEEVKQE